jgi:GPH family glycoside/pentoside/hexuronide:cation symporter
MAENGPWVALFISGIFALMNVAVRNGSMVYYLKYYVGDDGTRLFLIFDKTSIFISLTRHPSSYHSVCSRSSLACR